MMKKVQEALRTLKGGKSPGANNVPEELLRHGGAEMIEVLIALFQSVTIVDLAIFVA